MTPNNWHDVMQHHLVLKKRDSSYRTLLPIEENRERTIVYEGQELLNFASNDYLGLCHDARLVAAGCREAQRWGAGSGASRLVTGTTRATVEFEERLASWHGRERALLFNSGYHANIGVLAALASRDTVVFTDKLNHASIYDGIVLSRCVMKRYRHGDAADLESQLEKSGAGRKIIITDAVFSMEGDLAPLMEIARLAKQHGALLIVDEAHSVGLFGPEGQGLAASLGLGDEVDIIMGTLGKSFGGCGAYIAARTEIVEYLINHARSFIFTTALPPFVIGALHAALDIIMNEKRGDQLLRRAANFLKSLQHLALDTGLSSTQIIPLIVKENGAALELMDFLRKNGVYAPAIRPPTVPQGQARIRLSLSYSHTERDLKRLHNLLEQWQIRSGS
jgi:8-amino-7-oxononanoate synthase